MASVPIRRETEMHRGRSHVRTEAGTGGRCGLKPRNTPEGQPPPAAGRGKEGTQPPPLPAPTPAEPSEGLWPGLHLDFQLLASRDVSEWILVALNTQHVVHGHGSPRKPL